MQDTPPLSGPARGQPGSSLIFRPASWLERLSVGGMFREARPLQVELGSGDGSFMARWAAESGGVNFIAVERLLGRLRKLDRKGLRLGLENLRLMRIEAAYFLEFLLPLQSVAALHLYFPDPWPKRKQRRHRLVNERFPELCSRVLAAGGMVYLRTDDADYFGQMQEVFAADPRFVGEPTPEELAAVVTDFERTFNAQGIPTLRAAYRMPQAGRLRAADQMSMTGPLPPSFPPLPPLEGGGGLPR